MAFTFTKLNLEQEFAEREKVTRQMLGDKDAKNMALRMAFHIVLCDDWGKVPSPAMRLCWQELAP